MSGVSLGVIPFRRQVVTARWMVLSATLSLAAGSNPLLIDCEPAVVHTIASARAGSTRQLYATCWNFFSSWCKSRGLDPLSCDVPKMLSFLQQILESGKAASTLKVYAAAISAYHVPINESSLGSHALICSFLMGAR